MPTYKLRNVGQVGVITDIPPFDLPPNAWSDAINVRFDGYKIEKFGGNKRLLERQIKDMETGLALSYMRDTRTDISWIMATDKSIYKIKSPTLWEVATREKGGNYSATADQNWTYTYLSNILVMNNLADVPQGMKPNTEHFVDMPEWGKVTDATGESVQQEWRCVSMRAYKNFLIGMNMYEEGGEYPQRIRWSDIADVSDFPPNWDSSSTTSSSGFNDLTDASGEIIDGLPLRDSFVIYTTEDTFLMQYIGGNSIFRFTKLFTGSGLLSRQCVTEFDGKHFVISQNDIYVHDGSSRKSVVAGRIREKLMDEILSVNPLATRAFTNYPKKEIWVMYCRPGTDLRNNGRWTTNKAAVWNWEFDTWTFYDLPENFDVNLIPPLQMDDRRWENYSDTRPLPDEPDMPRSAWGAQKETDTWEITGQNFSSYFLVGLGKFGTLYQLDVGDEFNWDYYKPAFDNAETITDPPMIHDSFIFQKKPLLGMMERKQLDFDEAEVPTWANVKVRKIYPQFYGEGAVDIDVGGADDPQSTPRYKQRQNFEIGKAYQTSFRVNNKYIAIKFTDSNKGRWKFNGFDLDILVGGTR